MPDYGEEGLPFDILNVWYEDDLNNNADGYDYELADAPLKSPGKNGGSSNGSGASTTGSSSANGAGVATRQPLASTHDATSGALPLGLAAAGAGMLAYSCRREHLEQESEDEA